MELKDFITETLTQMMEGVKNAQEKAKEFGAIINPPSEYSKEDTISTRAVSYTHLTLPTIIAV